MLNRRAAGYTFAALGPTLSAFYVYGLFFSNMSEFLIKVTTISIILLVSTLISWLGYALIRSPSPKELKEIEREIDELRRRIGYSQ